ncbi:hypothetical protein [Saliterribacillus persicus]|uniref:Uncharacterized protein n=1 Tax=Saliterribacillus persicus TaxID=930114 RepID=A0A368XYQ6_9BACI|nr:hypothetical protein [Saliterribacillus persicus]RCW73112.1 hypothetical protein DFR57_104110 [Saliterribacillus persicus]
MIFYQWKNFQSDTDVYTQAIFEKEVGDEFEAMMYEANSTIPKWIWTKHFVIQLKSNARMYQDISFVKIPRNPQDIVLKV